MADHTSTTQRLVDEHAITTAQSIALRGWTSGFNLPENIAGLTFQSTLLVGGGGTNCITYIQTTLDGGTTWTDIAAMVHTTSSATKYVSVSALNPVVAPVDYIATDGSMTNDTGISGIIGSKVRVKVVTTGTYTGTTHISVDMKMTYN